jgi:glycosyltransferase involved in cell wall biosynthesis
LKGKYRVSVVANETNREGIVEFFQLRTERNSTADRLKKAFWLKLRQFDRYFWTPGFIELAQQLEQRHFDLIITHDLSLLPLVFRIRQSAQVLFDAREYYPQEYEDRFTWRFFFKDLNHYLCRHLMTKCDQVVTVSQGLADEYRRAYGIDVEVILSLPFYHTLEPSVVDENRIRMIHHGNVDPSRKIENMIQLMDHLDQRFWLDLMLVSQQEDSYYQFLQREAGKRSNVRIIPPVRHAEIIPFTNHYDIGLYYLEPVSFNIKHAMPNKLFEYIQARLAVAVTPTEMRTVVERYDCGIVSPAFDIRAMAATLNALSTEQIAYYKHQSHLAADQLNASVTCQRQQQIIGHLLGVNEN